MLYPMWWARVSIERLGRTADIPAAGYLGLALFFAALLGVGVASNLRVHLWFTSRYYPAELAAQRTRSAWWIRCGDVVFSGALVVGALAIAGVAAPLATLLVGAGIATVVSFAMVEPATARAAFRRSRGRSTPRGSP